MRVSVLIPARNAEGTLERAVNSVLATQHDDLEIVIVDDGSSDSTPLVGRALAQRYAGCVTMRAHPDGGRHGVSATRNLALAHSTGSFVCFLDADDFVLPNRFSSTLPILAEHPGVDGVYGTTSVLVEDAGREEGWMDGATMFGLTAPLTGVPLLGALLSGTAWHMSAIIVRRALLAGTGAFDERFDFAEDHHLWLRLAALGRIVPGDLSSPVSTYVRHGNNTYHYLPERRVDMLRAMICAHNWAVGRRLPSEILATLRDGTVKYFLRGVIATREAARPDVSRALLMSILKSRLWASCLSPAVLRQVPHVLRESA